MLLNRRHIRIKILQVLFAYHSDEKPDAVIYEKTLHGSFEKFRDLYLYLLQLITEMQSLAIDKIEAGRNKKLPTPEDLHPNTKFVTNGLLRILANSKALEKECKSRVISWNENRDLLKQIFKILQETDDYKEYMLSKERGFEHDREYLLRFFRRHIINVELMHDYLEELNIFWIDDLDLASSMVLKTLKKIEENEDDVNLLPLWDDENKDEFKFMIDLYRKSLGMGSETEALITKYAENWESDRIATMDLILMKMALTEASIFPEIPLKVTLNEYIEISKFYSTPKSSVFINGMLDKIFEVLKVEGKIKKTGRGLIE
ncbi:MAG: transcription antitermination factor NusB [Flavobacteriales bacterium]|nr:transcription antitermination factor NusB [Flavobacteriales bacterium]